MGIRRPRQADPSMANSLSGLLGEMDLAQRTNDQKPRSVDLTDDKGDLHVVSLRHLVQLTELAPVQVEIAMTNGDTFKVDDTLQNIRDAIANS